LTAALVHYQQYMAITLTPPDSEVVARVAMLEALVSADGV
jgi:hypothetical protein